MRMSTIRTRLLDRFVMEDGGREWSEDDTLAEAVYRLFRGDPEFPLDVDGWAMFRVMQETDATLRAVGLMAFLSVKDSPMEVELTLASDAISWSCRLGLVEGTFWSQSESKRWKALHLYSTGEREPEWTWTDPWHGRVVARRSEGS